MRLPLVAGFCAALIGCRGAQPCAPPVDFLIEVVDENGQPAPSRVHLRDSTGRSYQFPEWPAFDDHFVFSGRAAFSLKPGRYTYEIERGPEYYGARGSLEVSSESRTFRSRLERLIDMAALGWHSGDLHVHRKPADVPLLMRAEGISIAPVVTWWNGANQPPARPGIGTAGEDERQGGALLYFGLDKPLPLPAPIRDWKGEITHRAGDERDELPTTAELAQMARREGAAHVDIEKPFWWDAPTWVALGIGDTIEIAYNHMTRASLHNDEAWGKTRPGSYRGPFANALWAQDVYYRLLDTGIRIPPSAGSASGALPNPVGYDRVYVHLDGPFDQEQWWRGLKAGRSFVTNGPLLLVEANGQLPGTVFAARKGASFEVALKARVAASERIRSVEVIREGRVAATATSIPPTGMVELPRLSFERSGWFLVRAIADRNDNFHFASTAPFYVEVDGARRISRTAVQFFVGWIEERMRQLQSGTMPAEKLQSALAPQRAAEAFWKRRLSEANAE
jgi:hypothetical protein